MAREEDSEGSVEAPPPIHPPEPESDAESVEGMFESTGDPTAGRPEIDLTATVAGAATARELPPVRNFDDARVRAHLLGPESLRSSPVLRLLQVVFKRANPLYERAKRYYVLDGYVSNHIAILKDQSELYRQLAIFERDGERKVKMHRRRAVRSNVLRVRWHRCSITVLFAGVPGTPSYRAQPERIRATLERCDARAWSDLRRDNRAQDVRPPPPVAVRPHTRSTLLHQGHG